MNLFNNGHISDEVESLTSFRFVTAFFVFLFHCTLYMGLKTGVPMVDNILSNSAVFMSGFFVLSGYLLTHRYIDKDMSKKFISKYFWSRFVRIYPTYVVVTFFYFALFQNESLNLFSWLRIVFNDIFLLQAYMPSMFSFGINGGTWSLSVEVFFYILFPILMPIIVNNRKAALIVLLFVSFVISFNVILTNHDDSSVNDYFYANPLMRLPEFCAGILGRALLGAVEPDKSKPFIIFSISCLLLLIVTSFKYSSMGYNFMGYQLVITPLFVMIIYGLHKMKHNCVVNSIHLRYLGLISYSFYLWQFVSMELGRYLYGIGFNPYICVIISFVCNVLLASFSYHFIENKLRIKMNKLHERLSSTKSSAPV